MKISNDYGHCQYCLCHDCAMIHDLYVKKEHRRKGVAKDLLQKAINYIREDGYLGDIKIVADSEEDIERDILIKFYEGMNLKVI